MSQDLRTALEDALDGLREMIGYVDPYFVERWDLQSYIDRAKKALGRRPCPFGACDGECLE